MALDEAGGRVFVVYGYNHGVPSTNAVHQERGQVCLNTPNRCVGGVLILDALTLQQTGRIDLRDVAVDGGVLPLADLVAMEFAPPRGPGDAGKILLLLDTPTTVNLDQACVQACNPENWHATPQYLVQLDPDSQTVDWTLRLDACHGSRSMPSADDNFIVRPLPHHSALFRSASVERPAVVVGCRFGPAWTGTVVQVPLDDNGAPAALPVVVDAPSGGPDFDPSNAPASGSMSEPAPPVKPAATPLTITGPDRVVQMLSDPMSERLFMRVVDGGAEVWWVYDQHVSAFIATIGIGAVPAESTRQYSSSSVALDRGAGRLYVLASPDATRGFSGGLFVTDIRRTPVPQALVFPEFADLARESAIGSAIAMMAAPAGPDDAWPRTLYVPNAHTGDNLHWTVLVDSLPVSVDPFADFGAGRTQDLGEMDGVTEVSADGAARGYGARLLLVGGVDGAARVGPVDPVGSAMQCNADTLRPYTVGVTVNGPCSGRDHNAVTYTGHILGAPDVGVPGLDPLESPCTASNREIVLGAVGVAGPAVLDGSGGRGSADPIVTESGMRSDLEAPASRCSGKDWASVWSTALFGRAPVAEPSIEWPGAPHPAACVSGEQESEQVGDPVIGLFAASMDCGNEEVGGYSYVRGEETPIANVAEALSSFRIYRDPGRGIVARIESVARGLNVPGVLRIDTVRGVAESWANGRSQRVAFGNHEPGYAPNCDFERTAGTCFQRHVMGVWTPVYTCGPCGDEAAFVDGISRALGSNGTVRLRQPDELLARGAENGFAAGVVKPASERFADLALNSDLLQTVLPTLEIVRYAPPSRMVTGGGTRGRQIIQLAGVEVSTSYSIQCLLVYDEAANTCGAAAEPPGSIAVNLTDSDGKALAGGAFEVRTDADTDGVVGLKDALLPNGACVTADDGVGTCKFDNLQPGSYLVSQVAAPPGYGKVADPFVVELASGEARTVTFQNTSNVSTIAVSAADEAGKPVSGAQFAVYGDPDSDGKVAADAKPAATCTTDASGSCSMQVPAGSYVLVQTAAPGGLEPIEPVAFTFASGGQTAAVGVVNYPAGGVPAVEPAAGPVEYSAPPAAVVTETVDEYTPAESTVAAEPRVSIPEAVGGTIVRVVQAPGDALRLLSRDPKQAVAWTASLLLFALAMMAVRRRQQAIELIHE